MSTEVEFVKKLIHDDLMVEAVELPPNHKKKPLIADDIEEALSRFDDDADYAHFIIRVKRSKQRLSEQLQSAQSQDSLSINSLVNETLDLGNQITEKRNQREEIHQYDPDFLLENAKILEENGDFSLARNIYQAMVRKGVQIPQGLVGMARTYEKEGQNEDAIRCYLEAIAYSSELHSYQALAALQIRIGRDQDATETLLRALGLPDLTSDAKFDFHKSLGNCFTRLSEPTKAEHHYWKAYELNPKSDVLQVNVGSLALQKGDYDAAQKHFEKALELNPKNDKAISGLGMVYLAHQQPQKAHDHFVSSLKINLSNLGAIYNLVKCAYELKKFNDAAEVLKNYVDTFPVNTNILYSYAGILYHQGEYRHALAQVQKILEDHPGHAGAKELGELIRNKLD